MKPKLLLLTRQLKGPEAVEGVSCELSTRLSVDYDVLTLSAPSRSTPLRISLFAFGVLLRVLRGRLRTDLVLAGDPGLAPAGILAARLLGVPLVTAARDWDTVPDSWWNRKVLLSALRKSDGVLAADGGIAAGVRDVGMSPSKVKVLPFGIPLAPELLLLSRRDARESLAAMVGEPIHRRPLLLSFAVEGSDRELGLYFRDVFPKLVRQFPDLLHVVVGQSERRNQIECALPTGTLRKNLIFLEPYSRKFGVLLMRAANALVLPRSGRMALQANALGLPVVASSDSAVAELVIEGTNGVSAPLNDADAFFGQILFLLNRIRERDWSVDCRDHVACEFSWERCLPKITQYLEVHRNSRFRVPGLLGLEARLKS